MINKIEINNKNHNFNINNWYKKNKETLKSVSCIDIVLSSSFAMIDYYDKKEEFKNIDIKQKIKYPIKKFSFYLLISLLSTIIFSDFITNSINKDK